MKSLVAILCVTVTLMGCTMFSDPNPMFDYDLVDHCEDVDCVIDVMDEHRWETHNPDRLMKITRDSPPVNLRYWRDELGTLKIKRMPDWVLAASWMAMSPMMGAAVLHGGLYGWMYDCTAYYSGVGSWDSLVHELQHCQGYMEGAFTGYPNFLLPGYTDEMKAIMKEEGVTEWTDTDFFKYTIPVIYEYGDEELEWHRRTYLDGR